MGISETPVLKEARTVAARPRRGRVLVFSPDLLPLEGLPTVGSGLRAWGLGQGLCARGHDVVFSMPQLALDAVDGRYRIPPAAAELAWRPFEMHRVVEQVQPDLVLVCGWPIIESLAQPPRRSVPVVLDQHGPHMFERHFQGAGLERVNAEEKQRALGAADYFGCAGERQLPYFRDWLLRSGWSKDECAERSYAIRFSLSPELPARHPSDELTFVYGGVWLPWQDPTNGLTALVEQLERRRSGRLDLFGGKHPWLDISGGVFSRLVSRLEQSDRVVNVGQVAHAELIRRYTSAHVAIDLMAKNPERELAVTSRTVEYLWCGLPVIYNDYSELSELIAEYDAGWTVNERRREGINAVLDEIFEAPEIVERKSANAQRLVREMLTWDRTVEPLDRLVKHATCRASAVPFERRSPALLGQTIWVYRQYGAREVVRRALALAVRAALARARSFKAVLGRAG